MGRENFWAQSRTCWCRWTSQLEAQGGWCVMPPKTTTKDLLDPLRRRPAAGGRKPLRCPGSWTRFAASTRSRTRRCGRLSTSTCSPTRSPTSPREDVYTYSGGSGRRWERATRSFALSATATAYHGRPPRGEVRGMRGRTAYPRSSIISSTAMGKLVSKNAAEELSELPPPNAITSPMSIIEQKAGKVRQIGDYSGLNDQAEVPKYKTVTIRSVKELMSTTKRMAGNECRDAFLHIPMHPRECDRTILRGAGKLWRIGALFRLTQACLSFGSTTLRAWMGGDRGGDTDSDALRHLPLTTPGVPPQMGKSGDAAGGNRENCGLYPESLGGENIPPG
ncbi:hypothetical protein BDK51DRAFT_50899 [Blyttiomyces helicus]|uniref:Uncharacterized protein n=1 Tax=Blyttiomyces helicus TaxID=388810 RepID=A0A4P9W3B3_9FUNG|nr:hypothetical protein BDK51DRAFT_50899 [Blyttiomyces helicus]|eukprot:RKO84606.1 hypothetical protein BDK51DRAFT_50899 [Blyttiomyces helicus]